MQKQYLAWKSLARGYRFVFQRYKRTLLYGLMMYYPSQVLASILAKNSAWLTSQTDLPLSFSALTWIEGTLQFLSSLAACSVLLCLLMAGCTLIRLWSSKDRLTISGLDSRGWVLFGRDSFWGLRQQAINLLLRSRLSALEKWYLETVLLTLWAFGLPLDLSKPIKIVPMPYVWQSVLDLDSRALVLLTRYWVRSKIGSRPVPLTPATTGDAGNTDRSRAG